MTRIRRKCVGGGVYHVMNRANGRLQIFRKRGGTVGIGHVYQGRFKSFPVESNGHYLTVAWYIESNPMRVEDLKRLLISVPAPFDSPI